MSGNPGAASTTTSTFVGGGSAFQIGNSGGTVGAYGTTPVSQRTTTLGTTVATTVSISTTTGAVTSWGFSTSTQANNLVTMVNDIYGALTSIGFIST